MEGTPRTDGTHRADDDDLASARTGDEDAFARLVTPYRRELRLHCYRMLGSTADAADAEQETLVRAWQGLGRFDGRHLRAWLYRIATNRCLTLVERRGRREVPVALEDGATDVPWLEPLPGSWWEGTPEERVVQRDTVRLAFVAALQHLPATQRAVLLLREVLAFRAAEVAEILGLSVASVNSLLQRARAAVADGLAPSPTGPGDALDALADRYVSAWESGDVEGIVALLSDDVRYSMPPLPRWYAGLAEVTGFLRSGPLQESWRFVRTTANGQLAFATYLLDDERGDYRPGGLDVLSTADGKVTEVVAFLEADFAAFGLPTSLPA
ncbi:sigma-70 family RNA polymerase sigma factor [Mumia sp. DW29H23]|uniref:sigma-70 family RNA polymerase sigma factor n=1 Tax=Mumia sp. DW29H23 TaxID=3421241 RepID=UPI003D694608